MKIKFIVLVSLCISTLGFSVEFINSGTGIAMVAIPSADSINVGGGKVTSVKDGEISSTSTDAVNGRVNCNKYLPFFSKKSACLLKIDLLTSTQVFS
jgi:hypothetical protein